MADYELPDDLRYSTDDEWARHEEGRVIVGITDFAQQQLGDIVYVEFPEVGSTVAAGDRFGVIESVKAVSELFAPIGGEVLEVNDLLTDRPEAVNADCYGDGWLISLDPSDSGELESLLDTTGYLKHIEEREG